MNERGDPVDVLGAVFDSAPRGHAPVLPAGMFGAVIEPQPKDGDAGA